MIPPFKQMWKYAKLFTVVKYMQEPDVTELVLPPYEWEQVRREFMEYTNSLPVMDPLIEEAHFLVKGKPVKEGL